MGGGLFDALPPVSSKKSTRDDEDEGAGEDGAKNQSCDGRRAQKINERDDVIETRREPSPTTQRRKKGRNHHRRRWTIGSKNSPNTRTGSLRRVLERF